MNKISVIVSTYSRADYLRRFMAALEMQTLLPHEVIIADDGSAPDQVRIIQEIMAGTSLPIQHVRQEDEGFRVAAIRNRAAEQASGDIFLFADADIILFPDSLAIHAAAGRGCRWTTGFVVRLTENETNNLTEEDIRSGAMLSKWPDRKDERCVGLRRKAAKFRKKSILVKLQPNEYRFRKLHWWGGQSSVPRAAFEKINGFDERFIGWGAEDIDLGLRLQIAGVQGRTVEDRSRAFHLYHPPAPPAPQARGHFDRPRNGDYGWKTDG